MSCMYRRAFNNASNIGIAGLPVATMALSLSNSATTNSCGRVTNKRKSSDGAWLRELASVVAGVTDTTLTATVSVDDALTPSSKQRSGSGTDDDMGTSIDHQILGSK